MKTQSLNKSLIRKLFLFGLIMVASFGLLSFLTYWYGVDKAVNQAGLLEAWSLERQLKENPGMPLPKGPTLSVFRNWDQLPEIIRQTVPAPKAQWPAGKYIQGEYPYGDTTRYFFLLPHSLDNGGQLFLLTRYTEQELAALVDSMFGVAFQYTFYGVGSLLVVLFLLTFWWMQQISRPFVRLKHWAENLGTEQEYVKGEYGFEELDNLASQLQTAVDRVRHFAEREHLFLRHASHELRTPLAVMQASLDTLQAQGNNSRPLLRAQKASGNMQLICNTLLWLARESDRPLESEDVDIKRLCLELISDLEYLLTAKQCHAVLRGGSLQQLMPATLLRIVLTNLLKNAFQYSDPGQITISITQSKVEVINPFLGEQTPNMGFGLGLELVKRICDRQGWIFSFEQNSEIVCVSISWQL